MLRTGAFWVTVILILSFSDMKAEEARLIFKAGEDGYACFRIPVILSTKNGSLLAFAEGRRNNCGDAGDIDLVLKRSADNGKTWTQLQVVWSDGANTCGNPAPVLEERSGRILLLSTWNLGTDHEPAIIDGTSKDTRRIFILQSDDDGSSWSQPREITGSVKRKDWTWYATGPVNGIQIQKGKHKGRLVIPCDHIEANTKKYYSHVVYSDNGGSDWQLGGTTPADLVNESTVAEAGKGLLILNMRNYGKDRFRKTATSKDGGKSWSMPVADTGLVEPVCQASLIAVERKGKIPVLVFSNPADASKRINMTIKFSFDRGRTWPVQQLVHAGPSAYSCLVHMKNGKVGILYEGGIASAYEGIVFSCIEMTSAEGNTQ